LTDTTDWVANPDRWDTNKGDPGFSDKRLADIQFAAALLAAVEAGHVSQRVPLQKANLQFREVSDLSSHTSAGLT
jgi:hypothetical protein